MICVRGHLLPNQSRLVPTDVRGTVTASGGVAPSLQGTVTYKLLLQNKSDLWAKSRLLRKKARERGLAL